MPLAKTTDAAPQPRVETGVAGLIIGERKFLVNPDTQTFSASDAEEIKTLLAGKRVTLLCSVSSNKLCEGEYVKAQIAFLYQLLEQGIIEGLDVVIADSLQRHNHRINKLRAHTAFVASEIATLIPKLKFKGVDNAEQKRIAILKEVEGLKLFTFPEDGNSYPDRQIIHYKLKKIREQLTAIENHGFKETNHNTLKEIFLLLNHFDLHVLLNSLKLTLAEGKKWYEKLSVFLEKYKENPEFRVLYWRDLFGSVYSKQQAELDRRQLVLLREEHAAELRQQSSESLDAYEQSLLSDNLNSDYTAEEQEIINKHVDQLAKEYKTTTFPKNSPAIVDELQKKRMEELQNLYKTGNKEGVVAPNQINDFAEKFDKTGNDYLSQNSRDTERKKAGITTQESKASYVAFLQEEGIIIAEPSISCAYPRRITPGLAAMIQAFAAGPWGCIVLSENGKFLEDSDEIREYNISVLANVSEASFASRVPQPGFDQAQTATPAAASLPEQPASYSPCIIL